MGFLPKAPGLRRRAAPVSRDESPFHYELLNIEQLRRHARDLAGWQKVDYKGGPSGLLARLDENRRLLNEINDLLTGAAAEGRPLGTAAEWLTDNHYLYEQQIRLARLHLPRRFIVRLPALKNKGTEDRPRVYDMALELIAHVDGRVDAESVTGFVAGYQEVAPLTLGELWAFPIMLRLGLIENLSRIAGVIATRHRHRSQAAAWAERLIRTAEEDPRDLIQALAALDRMRPPMSAAFVQEFVGRLRGRGPALEVVLSWLERELADRGLTSEQILKTDSHEQSALSVSVANNIASLRFLGAMDWRDFVEGQSVIERTLRRDPAGAYASQEFETRDRYRRAVEDFAAGTAEDEEATAAAAVRLAAEARTKDPAAVRTAHVGYYLVGRGRGRLGKELRRRPSLRTRQASSRPLPLVFYAGPIVVLAAGAAAALVLPASRAGLAGPLLVFLAVAALIAGSSAAVAAVNLFALRLVRPRMLPRLDFSRGIPPEHRTMAVVPCLLSGEEEAAKLVEDLEIRYLGNRDPNLFFALLTDFPDADQPVLPEDERVLGLARDGIRALDERYRKSDGRASIFFLLHRPRTWNPHERLWMGYERKRGKLEQFNALLRGGPAEAFQEIVGDRSVLPTIRYVITLDRDTHLVRDAGARLAATLAHPLNRPVYDPDKGRIVEGHAVLQPRVSVRLTSANRSAFARLLAGDTGIDPYTREVSDVYQDLFDEGSYTGKGIYDVDAFMKATAGRFPENLILSHDLIEGCYARSALVTDIEFVEDVPSSVLADAARRHRWTRGDWQIMGRIWPWVRDASGRLTRNRLTLLSKWKIFDNLRRSLVPPALLAVFAGGLAAAPRLAAIWMIFGLGVAAAGPVLATGLELAAFEFRGNRLAQVRTLLGQLGRRLAQAGLALALLPHESLVLLGALTGSALRLASFRLSRRKLLLWYAANHERRQTRRRFSEFAAVMWVGPAAGLALAIELAATFPPALPPAAVLLAAWICGPWVAWRISRATPGRAAALSRSQTVFLKAAARRTWAYFEGFVGAGENWLPPDNFQETPGPRVAMRTSPTNLGMNLQANLAALDLGYLSPGRFLDRTASCLAAMESLERYRGHFYNWYDTETGLPLRPRYISSVDSGNLLGSLIVLRAGLRELRDSPLMAGPTLAAMLEDLETAAAAVPSARPKPPSLPEGARSLAAPAGEGLVGSLAALDRIAAEAAAISAAALARGLADAAAFAEALAGQATEWRTDISGIAPAPLQPGEDPSLEAMARSAGPMSEAAARLALIEDLDQRAASLENMSFDFLYDTSRDLLAIGFRVDDHRRDPSSYDLLASEARFASYILIARGVLPQKHWFSLGRLLTKTDGGLALLSWSGSMFEYLMPLIWMPMYDHTLLDQTYQAVVVRQRDYGRARGIPWGISESCYNVLDSGQTYQYGAFGVPGLGFKRDLGEDLVVAPYAAILALMVSPDEACRDLRRMASSGFLGTYGFYEAADYTASRLPRGRPFALIRSYMTHHQGMSLLALDNVLLPSRMQERFLSDPMMKATERLLHERVPLASPSLQPRLSAARARPAAAGEPGEAEGPWAFTDPQTPAPVVHLLSNGSYHVMTTAAGGGFSRWKDLDVTRWREDATCDCSGTFIYLREPGAGPAFSAAFQPVGRAGTSYEAIFAPARTEYRRRDGGWESVTEIAVSAEDDVEIRQIRITNLADRARRIEITSYAEVVLDSPAADLAHRVFNNLFVETEIDRGRQAILCRRRPRGPGARTSWMLHFLAASEGLSGEPSYETDRERFVGRGRSVRDPAVLDPAHPAGAAGLPLSGSAGAVLDPIVAMRRVFEVPADGTVVAHVISGAAGTRQDALALIDKYREARFVERAFEMAWSHNQVILSNLGATESEVRAYEQLAGSILFAGRAHRSPPATIAANRLGQAGLWRFGISGDLPIVLVRVGSLEGLDLVRGALKAHAYWQTSGLRADLVILNEDFSGYRQNLQDSILRLMPGGSGAGPAGHPGGVFLRRGEELSEDERVLFMSVARIVLSEGLGSLRDQALRRPPPQRRPPAFRPVRREEPEGPMPLPSRERVYVNGPGGFTPDGREYVIALEPGETTPAPWVNVIANPKIGTVVSESGGACTWVENAHEFRLTAWHNDPVADPPGEAFYIRDEETGLFWSPAPGPAPGRNGSVCRHGFGYTVFEHYEAAVFSELWTYAAVAEPVKFAVVRLRNHSGRTRRMSVTGFWDLVLGEWRHMNHMHVVTALDPQTGAVFARNPFARDFASRTVFAAVSEPVRTVTGDRGEFIGRNGSLRAPAALSRAALSGKTGAGLDPCFAISAVVELAEGEEKDVVFLFGAASGEDEARRLVGSWARAAAARQALRDVWDRWNRLLGAVYVESPDKGFDILVNGWLVYQALSARLWGRCSFYQSSGAYGFRDQLQDVLSLLISAPQLARDQILLHAEHQFREGDVQHWWHPPSGRGVRTHISDDMLWLPYAVLGYVRATGDAQLLDEERPFLEGRALDPGEDARFDLWQQSEEKGTVYEHCVRALKRALAFGPHGLPLMGSGDWNDGLNLVGRAGHGESVWLAWFLADILTRFAEVADGRGDAGFGQACRDDAARLRRRAEDAGWDGRWYLRAFFDDGSPLGSAASAEARIDSLPQSWAVLSGTGSPDRMRQAMGSVLERLYVPAEGLVKLLEPPFDVSPVEPGYIKAYPPGVRENGGHYSHAGIWVALALARLGEKAKAWELFRALSPVTHGGSPERAATFRVEPYVMPADICSAPPHTGRGGWTWYTGSAGWMYQLAVDALLGFRFEADRLRLEPLLPDDWSGCRVHFRFRETVYHCEIERQPGPAGDRVLRVLLDGLETGGPFFPLADDRIDHRVEVVLGPQAP